MSRDREAAMNKLLVSTGLEHIKRSKELKKLKEANKRLEKKLKFYDENICRKWNKMIQEKYSYTENSNQLISAISYWTLSSPPLSSPSPVNLEKSWSLKDFQQKILCKKLGLWTYCELDLLIFVCFSYLNTMK